MDCPSKRGSFLTRSQQELRLTELRSYALIRIRSVVRVCRLRYFELRVLEDGGHRAFKLPSLGLLRMDRREEKRERTKRRKERGIFYTGELCGLDDLARNLAGTMTIRLSGHVSIAPLCRVATISSLATP